MKRSALVGLSLVGVLMGTNALLERRRHCHCPGDCWCRTSAGRYFRWVVPIGHRNPQLPEDGPR